MNSIFKIKDNLLVSTNNINSSEFDNFCISIDDLFKNFFKNADGSS